MERDALTTSLRSAHIHSKGEPLPEDVKLTVKASIGKPTNQQPGFQLAVEIELDHSSFSSVSQRPAVSKVLKSDTLTAARLLQVLPDSTDAERLLSAAHQMVGHV